MCETKPKAGRTGRGAGDAGAAAAVATLRMPSAAGAEAADEEAIEPTLRRLAMAAPPCARGPVPVPGALLLQPLRPLLLLTPLGVWRLRALCDEPRGDCRLRAMCNELLRAPGDEDPLRGELSRAIVFGPFFQAVRRTCDAMKASPPYWCRSVCTRALRGRGMSPAAFFACTSRRWSAGIWDTAILAWIGEIARDWRVTGAVAA